jgi:hypothetical protein
MALGAQPSGAEFSDALRAVCPDVQCIGDAATLGYIDGAMSSGHAAGRQL